MANDNRTNNIVQISGKFSTKFEYHHELHDETFYMATLDVRRNSGAIDHIPVMASEYAMITDGADDKVYGIIGSYRSYNNYNAPKGSAKLELFVFADEIMELPESEVKGMDSDRNIAMLNGYICKEPQYRKTPLEREITDMIVAVNRPYGKSDYIPCISWGGRARFASRLKVGENVFLSGRIQSREYQKKVSEKESVTRTAYELSISNISRVAKEG